MPYSHQRRSARRDLLAALLLAVATAICSPTKAAAQGTSGSPATRVASATDSTPPAGVAQPARWIKKKIFFIYQGFQTQFVCQGLTDQVRKVLLELGARKSDMDVHEANCSAGFNQPTPAPAVAGTFFVLEPVPPEQAYSPNATPGAVVAHWQPVQVQLDRPGRDVNGQCELLDQVKHRILPLFATRNVKYESACTPYEEVVGGTSLRLEVLMPDRSGDVARE
jgi:hypothetical protein